MCTSRKAVAPAWTAVAIVREEERLNAGGETPRRWMHDRRAALLGAAVALVEAVEGLGPLGIEAADSNTRRIHIQ